MFSSLTNVTTALNQVMQVGDHAHFRPKLTVLIKVNAPWIASPFAENLKGMGGRMKPPGGGVDPLALGLG